MNIESISYDDMIACARRELAMRQRVYPKWVKEERMNQQKADHEIACMAAIVEQLLTISGQREERLL